MGFIKSYRDLKVWQKGVDLVTLCYSYTSFFPKEEQYGLTNQMRRCAVSIPSNIAEGYGRSSSADYKRFLHMALGSLYELQTQIEIAKRLNYLTENAFFEIDSMSTELDKMLYSLIKKIN
ncbi:four helix bundle protein [Flectobacillus longus]|uniref:four helix bundle protein n=1 Tax=Flectobacillus longus TaxID=2984207 RepID=UPI0024B6C078|nr:four helix bundle protein [Flectobacillus longus]MDI9879854.1 four helix bundle protein [Flectobacillus longus]